MNHILVLKQDGSVWAWGRNDSGQLGDGTVAVFPNLERSTPAMVQGLSSGVIAIAAWGDSSFAIKQDGSAWAWGNNSIGVLGDGTTTNRATPVKVIGITGAVTNLVGAWDGRSLALGADGSVWAWGQNNNGQLADGTTTVRYTAAKVPGLAGVVGLAAGGSGHSLALKSDGSVLAWGFNGVGQLGDGTFAQRRSPVLAVNGGVNGFLNLNVGTVFEVPPSLGVPFFVESSGGITGSGASVATTTRFNAADVGKAGAVYITAMAPVGAIGTATSPLARSAGHPVARNASAPPGFALIQLTPTGWQAVVNGQLLPYASGVLGDQLAAQTILNGTDTADLKGAEFCLGYGTSAGQMISDQAMRAVATIPDPGATGATTVSCIVPPVTTVNTFSFIARANEALSSSVVSDSVTVSGVNVAVAISVNGGEYSIDGGAYTSAPGMVSNGQSVRVRVTSSGAYQSGASATLSVGGASGVFNVSTLAAVPAVSLSTTSLVFASQAQGVVSAAQNVTLTSSGTAVVNIGGITSSGDFARTTTCGASLAPGANCSISINFSSTVPGTRTGTLAVATNAASSPNNVSLSGVILNAAAVTTTSATTTTSTTAVATSTTTTQATTSKPESSSITFAMAQGWNLLGNSLDAVLPVASVFGDTAVVNTVWKWNAASAVWQFYAPSLDAAALRAYAAEKSYGVLETINPGEGFWVNARAQAGAVTPSGALFRLAAANLMPSWNLAATGDDVSPTIFNASLKESPPGTGVTTLWAWDAPLAKWYFYAPSLEAQGGTALTDFIASRSYLDFTQAGKTLGKGTGFWVNRP